MPGGAMVHPKNLYVQPQSPMNRKVGRLSLRKDIPSSLGPFRLFPEYTLVYPAVVVKALAALYKEFNQAMTPLVRANAEWETDYRFCTEDGEHRSSWVQMDIVGLTDELLLDLAQRELDYVVEVLRRLVYEIENSLAMYPLLRGLFDHSLFKSRFDSSLNEVRREYAMPIALLAVTGEKYADMIRTEFGKQTGESVSPAEVRSLTGFDAFFGPEDFARHLQENDGNCRYLLYVRASAPPQELRKPGSRVGQPLLGDPTMRRIIRMNALTPNIDVPGVDSGKLVNDTKLYMGSMNMGFPVRNIADMMAPGLQNHLQRSGTVADFAVKHGTPFSTALATFLRLQGVAEDLIADGSARLHAKPGLQAFGCYGHCGGHLSDPGFRDKLRRGLRERAVPYVVQPHMPPAILYCEHGKFPFADRLFFALRPRGRVPSFLGGFRCMTPDAGVEGEKGRVHGGDETVWARIGD